MDDIDTILPPAGDHDAGTIEAALLSWQLASLRHEAEIQELDRDWEAEENRLASGDRDGIGGTLPTSSGSAWNFVQLLVAAVVWLVVAPFAAGVIATARGPASVLGRFVPLMGYALLGLAAWKTAERNRRAVAYDAAERRYREQRAALLARRSEPAAADGPPDASELRRQLEAVRRTIEVCRMDREWDEERRQYMTTQQSVGLAWGEGDTGSTSSGFLRPSRARALRSGLAKSGLGAVLFYAAVAMPSASSLRTSIGLVGAVLIAAAVFTVPSELSRAARYDEAERAYLARRERAAGGDVSEQQAPRLSA